MTGHTMTQSGTVGRCKIYDDELELLVEHLRPQSDVLEIGTLDGVTARLLAEREPEATVWSFGRRVGHLQELTCEFS